MKKILHVIALVAILSISAFAQPAQNVVTMQNAATATGNGTAINTASLTTNAMFGAVGFQVTGTFSATITFEVTFDGSTWVSVMATNLTDDTRATTATAAGAYSVLLNGALQCRARISAYTSGSVTVKGRLIPGLVSRVQSGGGGGGSGDVVGPASATDNAIARFNTTTGKLIQNSVVTVGDTGDVAGIAALTFTGVLTGGSAPTTITDSAGKILSAALNTVQPAQGGTGITALGTGIATALGVNIGSPGAPVLFNGAGGTPSSITLTNGTGLPISTGVSGLGTGVATALAVNTGSAGAVVLFNGAGGTPSSLTLTNATGLPPTTGISGWPANAAGVLTNNGSGTLSWGAAGGGGYATIQEEGSGLTQRTTLNFIGSSFTAADDSGSSRTNVTADSDLDALASNSTNGLWARTGSGTGAARTVTAGSSNGLSVTNGDGVSGNPTVDFATVNTAGLGYHLPGQGGLPFVSDTPAALAGSANEVRVAMFHADRRITVDRIAVNGVTDSAGNSAGFGIYSSDGNTKICDSGAISTTAWAGAANYALSGSCTFGPGYFIYAWTSNSTTPTARSMGASTNFYTAINNGTGTVLGTAANASSGGVLPSTLGSLTDSAGLTIPIVRFYKN